MGLKCSFNRTLLSWTAEKGMVLFVRLRAERDDVDIDAKDMGLLCGC